jgi:hypothetical protein
MSIKNTNIISTIVSIIAIFGFIGTLLAYSYTSGQKSHEIFNLQEAQKELELEQININIRIDEQFSAIQSANIRLVLLLDYFHITDSTRHN